MPLGAPERGRDTLAGDVERRVTSVYRQQCGRECGGDGRNIDTGTLRCIPQRRGQPAAEIVALASKSCLRNNPMEG